MAVLAEPDDLDDGDIVDCCGATMSWKQAERERPDIAAAAHQKELHSVFVEHQACHPVIYDGTSSYHRSHDLFDIKLADDSGKSRYVLGKLVEGELVDPGVPLYSPTMDMKLITMMLLLGLEQDLELSVRDVRAAFMQSHMRVKDVFVKLQKHMVDRIMELEGLPDHWKEYVREDGSMFVECDRAWYGHPAACSIFNADIDEILKSKCGYKQHSMVPCLYYRDLGKGKQAYIMLFVDDLGYLMPPNGVESKRVTDILEERYGELKKQDGDRVKYVGLEVFRNRKRNRFEVTMAKRTRKLAEKYNVTTAVSNQHGLTEHSRSEEKTMNKDQ